MTHRELVEAAEGLADDWAHIGEGTSLLAARVDEATSQVVVEVDGEFPSSLRDQLRASLSVPVEVQMGVRTSDAHCVSRSHCDAPTRAGIRLWKGVVDAVHECGLGAHIRVGSNERFVTSGHCGYTGSNNWLHKDMPGSDVLGAETGTKLYVNGGQDIMMVELDNDAQSSDDIYGCCLDIVGMGSPIQFEVLCTSRAQQQDVACGTVTNTWMQYISDTPDPDWVAWGADLTITAIDGDSGSPIWRDVNDVPLQVRAIGVLAAEFGEFARLNTSLDDWGATVVY